MKIAIKIDELVDYGAWFSTCKQYRFGLWRIWDKDLAPAMFLMLNPSTADATANDPTVNKCQLSAKRWGYGGILVGNVFAYRATDPTVMKKYAEPIGDENDDAIITMAKQAGVVICAWGNDGTHLDRANQVLQLLEDNGIVPHCLKVNEATGEPTHPLYLPKKLTPIVYTRTPVEA